MSFLKLKNLFVIFTALAFTISLGGCGKGNVASEIVSFGSGVNGTVTIAGSTSAQILSSDLGLIFMARNKDVKVNVSGGGSGIGLKGAQTKTVDLGAISRELKPDETGVTAVKIANDAVALIVNKENKVSDLKIEQIKDIYTGKITNWSQVGGQDAPINVLNREDGSGTLEVFKQKVLEKQNGIWIAGSVYNSSSAVVDAVNSDKNAMGYVSVSAVNNKAKILKVNGIDLTVNNVKSKKYTLVRPLYYVYSDSIPLSNQAQAFLDFVISDEGQRIIGTHGYIPLD